MSQLTLVELPVQGIFEPSLTGITAGVVDGGRPALIKCDQLLTVPVLILLKPQGHISDWADLAKAGVILHLLMPGFKLEARACTMRFCTLACVLLVLW